MPSEEDANIDSLVQAYLYQIPYDVFFNALKLSHHLVTSIHIITVCGLKGYTLKKNTGLIDLRADDLSYMRLLMKPETRADLEANQRISGRMPIPSTGFMMDAAYETVGGAEIYKSYLEARREGKRPSIVKQALLKKPRDVAKSARASKSDQYDALWDMASVITKNLEIDANADAVIANMKEFVLRSVDATKADWRRKTSACVWAELLVPETERYGDKEDGMIASHSLTDAGMVFIDIGRQVLSSLIINAGRAIKGEE